jgi:Xaa-Pro aminopeptidase
LPDYLEDQPAVYYLTAQERAWDHTILDALSAIRARRRKRVAPPPVISDARLIVHQLRLYKSAFEQSKMLEVGALSAEAHARAMRACRPDMMEWELQNVIEFEFRRRGGLCLAYDSIVGSGENATILHYRENNRRMQAGDLVLIDAGAEKDYFAADITRTFPVSGRFSPVQARVYQIVLDAQLRAIESTVEGATLDHIHDVAWNVLKDGLIAEGLVSAEQQADAEQLKLRVNQFYMHRTSHYLGMDVHDVGAYYDGKSPRPLARGAVITVEPGLYFAVDDESVPAEYRGLGIRIEDDVLVTEQGPQVLTEQAPKTILAIERMCQAEPAAF